jgi:hypothetical protein
MSPCLAIDARNASDTAFWLGLLARRQAMETRETQQPPRAKPNWPRPIDLAATLAIRPFGWAAGLPRWPGSSGNAAPTQGEKESPDRG